MDRTLMKWKLGYLIVGVLVLLSSIELCSCSSVGGVGRVNGNAIGNGEESANKSAEGVPTSSAQISQSDERRRRFSYDSLKNRRRLCYGLEDNLRDYTHQQQGQSNNNMDLESEDGGSSGPEQTEMVCSPDSQFCYSLWKYTDNGTLRFIKQGCWEASEKNGCMSQKCIARVPKSKQVASSSSSSSGTVQNRTSFKGNSSVHAEGTTSSETDKHGKDPGQGGPTTTTTTTTVTQKQHFFCCCDSDHCNDEAHVIYVDDETDDDSSEEVTGAGLAQINGGKGGSRLQVIFIFCGSMLCGILIIFLGYKYWRRLSYRLSKGQRQGEHDGAVDGDDGMSLGGGAGSKLLSIGTEDVTGSEEENIVDGIQLVVLLARGKFASVYEGKIPSLSDNVFALKCFNREQREFFDNERFVFNILGKLCCHDNIIKYYGWQEFTVGPTTHLILALDKITPGNLREYLQSVTSGDLDENETALKIVDVLHICSGIAAGLSYLHGENRDEIVIAHRDLTSKNILIDGETLIPKITDFGLSLVTRGSKYYWAGRERQAEFCSLAEAGTLRYMAPELLEGAVNLKDCENALKQADVYALALILWEVANCSRDVRLTSNIAHPKVNQPSSQSHVTEASTQAPRIGEGETDTESTRVVVKHSLPYEEEIGKENLSIDVLSRHVVQYRNRPHFRKWRDTPYTRQLRDTLVESWDAEPDARLTALCIVERLADIRSIKIKNNCDLPGLSSQHQQQQQLQSTLQTPLESPGEGGLYGELIDSPWTGRNPCLQRNLLTVTATSTNSGGGGNRDISFGMGGLSTSGSAFSESNSLSEPNHLRLNHSEFAKNQNNFYHNYVGGSSGGTSYSTSTSTRGDNQTELSNISTSIEDERGNGGLSAAVTGGNRPALAETRMHGYSHGQSAQGSAVATQGGPSQLPPTIPFVQNLHAL